MTPYLTIGFATRNDPRACITLNAFVKDHRHLSGAVEILIVDNSPAGSKYATELERHINNNHRGQVRYIRDTGPPSSCLYKDRLFREASGEVIVCFDAHVLLFEGAIASVAEHFQRDPGSPDLLMGVLCRADGTPRQTNQQLYADETRYQVPRNATVCSGIVCRGQQLGVWVNDERANGTAPYEVMMSGTWFMAMQKAAWPGFSEHFLGFGGCEPYLMERVRQAGGRVLTHPGIRGWHDFSKAHGQGYVSAARDKIRNYLVAAKLLGRDDHYAATLEYFGALFPHEMEAAGREASFLINPAAVAQREEPSTYAEYIARWKSYGGNVCGSVPRPLFDHLLTLNPRLRTLEYGSGLSTLAFHRQRTDHTAIEHDEAWLERVRPWIWRTETNLIHAPLRGGWYDWRPPPGSLYDVILIDGPPGAGSRQPGRSQAPSQVAGLLAPGGQIIIDDTHRPVEQQVSAELSRRLNLAVLRRRHGKRSFDILTSRGSRP